MPSTTSYPEEEEDDEPPPRDDDGGPVAKRRRRKEPVASPAQQRQPAKQQKPKKAQQAAKKKKPTKPAEGGDDEEAEVDAGSVSVTVQRFTKKANLVSEDDPDAEFFNADIPFANRTGVSTVDVLSDLCDQLIEAFLERLQENARNADDAATKREQKVKQRALEAFQKQLETRLLPLVSFS
jgi:hypothetical protein